MKQLSYLKRPESNQSLRNAGIAIMTSDTTFRDRVIQDEAKLQEMKRKQKDSMEGSILNMDDIDVLYHNLDKQPKLYQQIENLKNEINEKNLEQINNTLDKYTGKTESGHYNQ